MLIQQQVNLPYRAKLISILNVMSSILCHAMSRTIVSFLTLQDYVPGNGQPYPQGPSGGEIRKNPGNEVQKVMQAKWLMSLCTKLDSVTQHHCHATQSSPRHLGRNKYRFT